MIITKCVEIKITSRNKEYYESLGYNIGDAKILNIKTDDLTKGSSKIIESECDKCGKIKRISYKYYYNNIKNGGYFSCSNKCSYDKRRKTNLNRYGVENSMYLECNKDKIRNTCMDKYGVSNATKLLSTREKMKSTNLERYGVEYAMQNMEIFTRAQKAGFNLKSYGSVYYRGTYELDFLEKYYDKFILYNSKSVNYILNESNHVYHPDFYLPNYNLYK